MEEAGSLTLAALGSTGLGVLGLAGAAGVGLVFVGAAQAKWRHRELLGGVIANYRLLPPVLVTPAALLLPVVEFMVGIGLLMGYGRMFAPAAIALLAVFAAAMGINIARGRTEIDCGCGRSDLRQPLSWLLVVRNLLLASLLVPLLITTPRAGLTPANLAIALLGGLAVMLLYQLFNAIGALAASPLSAQRR